MCPQEGLGRCPRGRVVELLLSASSSRHRVRYVPVNYDDTACRRAYVDCVTKARRVLEDEVLVAGSGVEVAWQFLVAELEV